MDSSPLRVSRSFSLNSPLAFQPTQPSPLAKSDENASRRRAQYKSLAPQTPTPTRIRSSAYSLGSASLSGSASGWNFFQQSSSPLSPQESQRALLRERFKARCLERAVKARRKAIQRKRYTKQHDPSSDPSSDDFDVDMDDDMEEDDDSIMSDELFRRIMVNSKAKKQDFYSISYAREVASSEPDIDHMVEWENELREPDVEEIDMPGYLEDEELVQYAEECVKRYDDLDEDYNLEDPLVSDDPSSASAYGSATGMDGAEFMMSAVNPSPFSTPQRSHNGFMYQTPTH
ncbi:hypothetical protein FISHEDRAFT_71333 [Fistulina hepatica ATCC 64428]|nr:hypothetical protein FISHEDRAFT_71333 [Fistulina hepatica ATCC 64428]